MEHEQLGALRRFGRPRKPGILVELTDEAKRCGITAGRFATNTGWLTGFGKAEYIVRITRLTENGISRTESFHEKFWKRVK